MDKTALENGSTKSSVRLTCSGQQVPSGPEAGKAPAPSGPLGLEQLRAFTERDYDMECLADAVETRFLVSAPRDLRDSVLKAAARPDVRLERSTRKVSKQARLFFYSLKVGTAVAGALLLLSAAPDMAGHIRPPAPSRREFLLQESIWDIKKANDRLTGRIRQFSNDIFQNGGN